MKWSTTIHILYIIYNHYTIHQLYPVVTEVWLHDFGLHLLMLIESLRHLKTSHCQPWWLVERTLARLSNVWWQCSFPRLHGYMQYRWLYVSALLFLYILYFFYILNISCIREHFMKFQSDGYVYGWNWDSRSKYVVSRVFWLVRNIYKNHNSWVDRDDHMVNLSSQAFIWCVIMVAFSENLRTFTEDSSSLERNTCIPCVYIYIYICIYIYIYNHTT